MLPSFSKATVSLFQWCEHLNQQLNSLPWRRFIALLSMIEEQLMVNLSSEQRCEIEWVAVGALACTGNAGS